MGRFAGWKVGSEDGKKGKKLPIPFFMDFLKVCFLESGVGLALMFSLLHRWLKMRQSAF